MYTSKSFKVKPFDDVQGEIEGTKIKYCLNQENWKIAKKVFKELFKG